LTGRHRRRGAGVRLWTVVVPVRGPARILAAATLVNTLGHGLFMAIAVIYYTLMVGLSAAQVGAAVAIAAAFGFVASVPIGRVTDLVGARQMTAAANFVGAMLSASLLVVTGWHALVAVLSAQAVASVGSSVGRSAVIAVVFEDGDRVRGRAYLRTLTNIGLASGAALAVPAIAVGTPLAYRLVILCDALTFAVTGFLAFRLPSPTRSTSHERKTWTALHDRVYVLLTALNGVLSMQTRLFTVGVPLWIVSRTNAPLWTPAVLLVTNTVMVISLQIVVSRGTDDPAKAALAQRRAGLLLALACLVYAGAAGVSAYVALAVMAVGAVVHAVAEMAQAAGAWGLSYGLAPDGRHGEYQGVYALSGQLASMLAPALVTFVVVAWGTAGWVVLSASFAVAGCCVPPVARSAPKPTVTTRRRVGMHRRAPS
jgi:MFS family permease